MNKPPAAKSIKQPRKFRPGTGLAILLWVALLLGAILRLTWLDEPVHNASFTGFAKGHFEKGFWEAFTLALLLAGLAEIWIFKTASVSHLREIIGGDFIERASDPEFLRRLSVETRHKIEQAVHEAAFQIEPPLEVKELLARLSERREDLWLYRTGYVEVLEYLEVADRPDCFEIVCKQGDCTYYNATNSEQKFMQTVRGNCLRVAGFSDARYQQIVALDVDGVDRTRDMEEVPIGGDADRVEVAKKLELAIGPRSSLRVGCRYTKLQAKTEPFVRLFFSPVHGFDLTLFYPPSIVPQLNVFGTGSSQNPDPLEPLTKDEGYRRWQFDGWFLRDQGMVLSFAPALTPSASTASGLSE